MEEIAVENCSFTVSVHDGCFSVTVSEPHPTKTTTSMPKSCELCTRPSCRVRSSDPLRIIHRHLEFDTGTLTSHFLTLFNAEANRDRSISEASAASTSSKGKKRKKAAGKDKGEKRRSASKNSSKGNLMLFLYTP